MKTRDLLADWVEPEAIKLWGSKVSPQPAMPWLDYINYYIHPDVVAVVGRLLIPAFVEHEGGVFLRDQFTLSGYSSWKDKVGDISAVEEVINHRHVYDVFVTGEEISEASFDGVANLMAQTLRLALDASFPERRFNVYVSRSEQEYGPVVGFYSTTSSPSASGT